jgi:hypothetical protein
MNKNMRKGMSGIIVSLILITSIAAVTIPMAAGVSDGFDISGYKLSDTGVTLPNWTIAVNVKFNGYNVWENTTTDGDGYWEIIQLPSGCEVTVYEVLKDGWMPIYPEGGGYPPFELTENVTYLNFTNAREDIPGTGTPGYWKNHPEAWPVDTITIGGVTYTKAQAIANMSMPDGDKTYTMFRALVCAKLNVWIGNDASCIADTITAADGWMAAYGPAGNGVHADDYAWQEGGGEDLYLTLDDYNNGRLCAPHRDDLENGTDTGTFETDTTTETTTQENGKGKKKPKKPKK